MRNFFLKILTYAFRKKAKREKNEKKKRKKKNFLSQDNFCFRTLWLLVPATGKINFHRSEDFPLRNKAWKIIPRAFLSLRILSCYFFSQVILWLASKVLQKKLARSGHENSCSYLLRERKISKKDANHWKGTRNQKYFKGLKLEIKSYHCYQNI